MRAGGQYREVSLLERFHNTARDTARSNALRQKSGLLVQPVTLSRLAAFVLAYSTLHVCCLLGYVLPRRRALVRGAGLEKIRRLLWCVMLPSLRQPAFR